MRIKNEKEPISSVPALRYSCQLIRFPEQKSVQSITTKTVALTFMTIFS